MGIIRLLLACSVVIEHCNSSIGIKLLPGNMAVEMFFMISGFYMSMILSGKYEAATWAGRLDFYASRYWRLWPTFIITIIATQILWLAENLYLGHEPISARAFRRLIDDDLIYYAVQFSNVFMIGLDIPSVFHVSQSQGVQLTFGPAVSDGGTLWMGFMRDIGQAWSIGTEIWFYLLVPFLCRLATSRLLAIAAASFALRAGMDANGLNVYFFFPTQIALFIVGMIAQRHFHAPDKLKNSTALGGMVMIAVASLAFNSALDLNQTFKWVLYTAFALTMPSIFKYAMKSKADKTIGELSYPIYITHGFLLSVLAVIGGRVGIKIGGEMLLVVTILASWLLFVSVDKPIGRWRQRFARSQGKDPSLNAKGAAVPIISA
jgi:peptidoglycan/LPS O-acetylase OafA/YrhL